MHVHIVLPARLQRSCVPPTRRHQRRRRRSPTRLSRRRSLPPMSSGHACWADNQSARGDIGELLEFSELGWSFMNSPSPGRSQPLRRGSRPAAGWPELGQLAAGRAAATLPAAGRRPISPASEGKRGGGTLRPISPASEGQRGGGTRAGDHGRHAPAALPGGHKQRAGNLTLVCRGWRPGAGRFLEKPSGLRRLACCTLSTAFEWIMRCTARAIRGDCGGRGGEASVWAHPTAFGQSTTALVGRAGTQALHVIGPRPPDVGQCPANV